uniref:Tripartite motif-containing protein 16 n=1 Tax=Dicentrarchus labrax TaxID=13489 RepID=A0A8P4K300_DICLA
MAQQGDKPDWEKFCCSICLNPLKDPVTIRCGHSYCMNCIKSHWDEEKQKKIYSCPQCRQTFRPRPALVKNTMLTDLVEELKKTKPQAALAKHCHAKPGDVACDLCTGRKRKALKSCLQCLVSYCEVHLQPHYAVVPLKKHKLIEASAKFQENICSRHNEVMKIFCRTDRQCICYLCSMDEHKGHDTVVAEAEMTKRKGEIGPSRQEIQQRIQNQEKHAKMFQQEVEAINRSADKAAEESQKMYTELVLLTERSSAVKRKIRSHQEIEVSRSKELQEKLEQEIADLRRKDADLEELSHTEDQTQFLRKFYSLPHLSESTIIPRIDRECPLRYFEDVTTAVSEARAKSLESYSKKLKNIAMRVTEVDFLLPQDPKTRAEFSHYAVQKHQLKPDPNTANMQILLSDDNRKATSMREEQPCSSNLLRFMNNSQVLSRESLTGRCYWEVQWSGLGASIAVAQKDIPRTGDESMFGNNDKSWVLECLPKGKGYNFKHNSDKISISAPQASRIGVFVDFRAGILIFYSISESITVLHKVQTTFTQPLYAGLGVRYFGSTAEFCDIK